LRLTGVLWDGLLYETNLILLRLTLVAITTTFVEFGQKLIKVVDVCVVVVVIVVVISISSSSSSV